MKKYKFSELKGMAVMRAMVHYYDGWQETHPKSALRPEEIMDCLNDLDDEGYRYNKYGFSLEQEEK